jgi:hypothetical protein
MERGAVVISLFAKFYMAFSVVDIEMKAAQEMCKENPICNVTGNYDW